MEQNGFLQPVSLVGNAGNRMRGVFGKLSQESSGAAAMQRNEGTVCVFWQCTGADVFLFGSFAGDRTEDSDIEQQILRQHS